MRNVIQNKGDKKKYLKAIFTPHGQTVIQNYLKELVKIYFKSEVYPVKMGIVLDLPLFHWDQEIKSKDELEGRIKLGMKLLGINKIKAGSLELSFK